MRKLTKIAICLSMGTAFNCQGEWYSQNPEAWLKAIENTERARTRAFEDKVTKKDVLQGSSQYLPVSGLITGNFGMRLHPVIGELKHHNGIDIAAKLGTPITAVQDGVVVRATYSPTFGKIVELDHGNNKVTRYAHADTIQVKVGDYVVKGSQIATVGSTGLATGPHIHFEVLQHGRPVNPLKGLKHFRNNEGVPTDIEDIEIEAAQAIINEVMAVTLEDILPVSLEELKSIKLPDSVAIWDLANEIRGENSIYQAILAIYKLNPSVFIKGNINLRKRGVHIVLPNDGLIASMSRKEGIAKVNADNLRLKS